MAESTRGTQESEKQDASKELSGLASHVAWRVVPAVLLLYVLLVLLAFVFSMRLFEPWWDWDTASKLGDTVNVANTLFSGLAFAGVIIAIVLQTRELMLQRAELEETQAEMRKSAEAQERTDKALRISAYLNAATTMMSVLEQRMKTESNTQIRFAQRRHAELFNSLSAVLDGIDIRSFLPSKTARQIAISQLRSLYRYTEWTFSVTKERLNFALAAITLNELQSFVDEIANALEIEDVEFECSSLLGQLRLLSKEIEPLTKMPRSIDDSAFWSRAQSIIGTLRRIGLDG